MKYLPIVPNCYKLTDFKILSIEIKSYFLLFFIVGLFKDIF